MSPQTAFVGDVDLMVKEMGCHPCALVGIAKHPNTRTDGNPYFLI